MKVWKTTTVIGAAALGMVVLGFASAGADSQPDRDQQRMRDRDQMMDCPMMERNLQQSEQAFQKLHEQLQQKVRRMNEATSWQRVDAMADVINEMVDQRTQMHKTMRERQAMMMRHMMMHMSQIDNQEQMQKFMDECPVWRKHMGHGGMMDDDHGRDRGRDDRDRSRDDRSDDRDRGRGGGPRH